MTAELYISGTTANDKARPKVTPPTSGRRKKAPEVVEGSSPGGASASNPNGGSTRRATGMLLMGRLRRAGQGQRAL